MVTQVRGCVLELLAASQPAASELVFAVHLLHDCTDSTGLLQMCFCLQWPCWLSHPLGVLVTCQLPMPTPGARGNSTSMAA